MYVQNIQQCTNLDLEPLWISLTLLHCMNQSDDQIKSKESGSNINWNHWEAIQSDYSLVRTVAPTSTEIRTL